MALTMNFEKSQHIDEGETRFRTPYISDTAVSHCGRWSFLLQMFCRGQSSKKKKKKKKKDNFSDLYKEQNPFSLQSIDSLGSVDNSFTKKFLGTSILLLS
jgi:hypothetical protein